MTRRTKIVCTLGPAVDSYEQVLALVEAGMDVARFNFSHGRHAEHGMRYDWVRKASDATGHAVAVLADLQGPKIRLGNFADGPVEWLQGETVVITTDDVPGDHDRVSTTYTELPKDVRPGDSVLVDDGRVQLRVMASSDTDVTLKVVEGGTVSDHKGINLPGVNVSTPALTEKDEEDLRYALTLRADFIALSFVRSAADIIPVHKIMDEIGARLPVIAKVEKPEAVQALDQIIAAFDGVMVARGDLGVEMHLEDVPLVQKLIIDHCRSQAKPVIVATQMLESMITAARPTRAEASDVANAALDGADALMLSGGVRRRGLSARGGRHHGRDHPQGRSRSAVAGADARRARHGGRRGRRRPDRRGDARGRGALDRLSRRLYDDRVDRATPRARAPGPPDPRHRPERARGAGPGPGVGA